MPQRVRAPHSLTHQDSFGAVNREGILVVAVAVGREGRREPSSSALKFEATHRSVWGGTPSIL
eukprot:6090011-Amphidinium_carterae.1